MTRQEFAETTKRWFDSAAVTRATKIVAIASLVAALTVGLKQAQLTSCLAHWNDVNISIQQSRSAAAESDRKALDDMVSAIANSRDLPPSQVKSAVDQALLTYLKRRAYADGERAGNPLPDPPSATC